MSTVFVVGSVNEDLRLQMAALPLPGETVAADSAEVELGGKGANQAVAAARAGAEVRFVGSVGEDDAGRRLREALATEGIDISSLRTVKGVATGRAVVMVDSEGRNSIVVDAGANAHTDGGRAAAALAHAGPGDVLLCQLETDSLTVHAALRAARERGAFGILNIAPFRNDVLPMLLDADLIVANELERDDLRQALVAIGKSSLGLLGDRILCTLGAEGSELGTGTIRVAGARADAVDTTAAGDTYVGYLAARLADGEPIAEAMRWASVAAARTVERPGAARSIPRRDELDAASVLQALSAPTSAAVRTP